MPEPKAPFKLWLNDHAKGDNVDTNIAKLAKVSTMDPNFPEDGSVMEYVKYFVQAKAPQAVITALEMSFALYAPFKDWLKDAAEFVVDGHIVDKIHKIASDDGSFPENGTFQDFLEHLTKSNASKEDIVALKETFKHYSVKIHSEHEKDPLDVPEEHRANVEVDQVVNADKADGNEDELEADNSEPNSDNDEALSEPHVDSTGQEKIEVEEFSSKKEKGYTDDNKSTRDLPKEEVEFVKGFEDFNKCAATLKVWRRLPFKKWLQDDNAHGEISPASKAQIQKLAILAKADDFLENSSKQEYKNVMKSHGAPSKAFEALDVAYSIFAPFDEWVTSFKKQYKGRANQQSQTKDFLNYLLDNPGFPLVNDITKMRNYLESEGMKSHIEVLNRMYQQYETNAPPYNYGRNIPSSYMFSLPHRDTNQLSWIRNQKPRKFRACAGGTKPSINKSTVKKKVPTQVASRTWKSQHPELFGYPVLAEKIYSNTTLVKFLPPGFADRVSIGEVFDEGVLLDVVKQRESSVPEDVVSSFCAQALSLDNFPKSVSPLMPSTALSVKEMYIEGQVGKFTLRRQQQGERSPDERGVSLSVDKSGLFPYQAFF